MPVEEWLGFGTQIHCLGREVTGPAAAWSCDDGDDKRLPLRQNNRLNLCPVPEGPALAAEAPSARGDSCLLLTAPHGGFV